MPDIKEKKIKYFRKKILVWGKNNFRDFAWRKSGNKWHALIAEIMLQRTKAAQVLPVYEHFVRKYSNPTEFVTNYDGNIFENLGLPGRNKYLKKLNEILINKEIPESKEDLLELPCIGDYIASAFLSLHLGKRAAIIDSNIVRLYGRFFGFKTDGETRRKKWLNELAEHLTPRKAFKDFNYSLIDFTGGICKPKPLCNICIINERCSYYTSKGDLI